MITLFCDDVYRHLGARLDVWRPDFAHIQVHEVIGAMLARQATLAKEVAGGPSIWTGIRPPFCSGQWRTCTLMSPGYCSIPRSVV